MFLARCSLCDHVNPELSRFCNECGAWLTPAPSPALSTSPEPSAAPEPEPESDLPAHQPRQPRRHTRPNSIQRWLIACSPVATVLAGLGYFTYVQLSVTDVAGLLPATPVETQASDRAGGIVTVGVATIPRAPPSLAPASVWVADEPPATPAPAVIARPTAPREPIEPAPANIGPCTAAVAALGLCTPITISARE